MFDGQLELAKDLLARGIQAAGRSELHILFTQNFILWTRLLIPWSGRILLEGEGFHG